jgi:diacylglycerol O-acyltransferase / wax synthase
VKRLSSVDSALWFTETKECPTHISALLICDPSEAPGFSFGAVKDLIAARIPEMPVLRWRVTGAPLGLNKPWVVEDPDADLDYHLRRIAVPAPGGRQELEELVGRLASYPLDKTRPLWELWFIEGVEGGLVGIFGKMHHALIDGVSGASLLDIVIDTTSQPRPPATQVTESTGGNEVPGWERRVASGLFELGVVTPYRVAQLAGQTIVQQVAVRALPNKPPKFFEAPMTRFNASIEARRRITSVRLPLERLKAVKQAFDVKLNDVVMAIISGALRRYLQEREGIPDRPLIAQVPISTRAKNKRELSELGNQVTSMTVSLATDVADPTERLKTIYRSSHGAKEMQDALSAHQIMGLTETTPPGLLGLAARAYTASRLGSRVAPLNVCISNVPGPDYPYYVAGALVERIIPVSLLTLDGGLNITCFSYNGSIDFGLLSTPQIANDLDELGDGFEPALRELEEAAGLTVAR